MKKYLRMSSAAVVIGALRVNIAKALVKDLSRNVIIWWIKDISDCEAARALQQDLILCIWILGVTLWWTQNWWYTVMCLVFGTPNSNKFSICSKCKINYFQVSKNLGKIIFRCPKIWAYYSLIIMYSNIGMPKLLIFHLEQMEN